MSAQLAIDINSITSVNLVKAKLSQMCQNT